MNFYRIEGSGNEKLSKLSFLKISEEVNGKGLPFKKMTTKEWLNEADEYKEIPLKDLFDYTMAINSADNFFWGDSIKELKEKFKKFKNEFQDKKVQAKRKANRELILKKHFNPKKVCEILYYKKDHLKYQKKLRYIDHDISEHTPKKLTKIWGEGYNQKTGVILTWAFDNKKKKFYSDVVQRPVSELFFGERVVGDKPRMTGLELIKPKATNIIFHFHKIKMKRSEVFYYIIGLFNSDKYKKFITRHNFEMRNPPVPFYENYREYIKKGEKIYKTAQRFKRKVA